MKKSLLILAFAIVGTQMKAQQVPAHCGTDEYTNQLTTAHPELLQKYSEAENIIEQKAAQQQKSQKSTQGVVYTIPVVFHVIYNSESDNISRRQIEDGLRVLNADFRRQNADASELRPLFTAVADDMEIEFKLAKKDPNGNCTDGINRIQSNLSINANDNVKNLIHWDNNRYLNIWVVNSINSSGSAGTILGYAYRPYFGQTYDKDGIIIRHDRVGTIGTGVSRGRTLTHETGHFLGLKHPFTDGCSQGDNINDTPPVASANYTCNFSANSCHNDSPDLPDMIENYMDYADDDCQNTFTTGQKNYMRSTLETSGLRQQLRQPANHLFTGLTNPPACKPTADFSTASEIVCEGDTIKFIDETEDGDPDSYLWTFTGGVPSTSTDRDPQVYYPNPGKYDVTLSVSNAAGSSTLTRTAVSIKTINTSNIAEWRENFEAPQLNTPELSVNSKGDNINFELTNLASSSGSQSLFLDNFNSQSSSGVDEFVSPNIFTIFGNNLLLSFDYAYAKKATTNADRLTIYASTDCGKTWSLRRVLAGGILTTTQNLVAQQPFIPTGSEWKTTSIGFSLFEDQGPILIKFEFEGNEGNNLYIDNINFTADNIGLEELDFNSGINVYPNPSNGNFTIDFEASPQSDLKLIISDMYGRQIKENVIEKNIKTFTFTDINLTNGVYILNITDGQTTHTTKLIVQ